MTCPPKDSYPTSEAGVVENREARTGRSPGRNWAVAGIVVGALAFVLVPFFLGPLGILFGLIGFSKGSRRPGKIAIGVSIFSLIFGTILYVLFRSLVNGT